MLREGKPRVDVSVIVPTLNSSVINQTLDSLFEQTCFNYISEILVIGLDELGLVRERGPVTFISTGKPIIAPVSRNIGIRRARGDLLVFIDADCVATPTWLEKLLACQARGRPVVAGSVSLQTEGYRSLCYNLGMFSDTLVTSPAGLRPSVSSLNLLVTKEVINKVGLFNEDLPRSHDVEWSCRIRRAGYEIYFSPDAELIHLPRPKTWSAVFEKFYRSGFYSSRVRLSCRDMFDTPWFFDHPLVFGLLFPFLSAVAVLQTFTRNRGMWRYLHTAPMLFACKVAWCLGASHQIRSSRV
jgi:glycosyltransferase involved in cell wall biosynthesis